MYAILTNAGGETATLENPDTLTICVADEGEQVQNLVVEFTGGILTVNDCLSIRGNTNLQFPEPFLDLGRIEINAPFSGSTCPELKP